MRVGVAAATGILAAGLMVSIGPATGATNTVNGRLGNADPTMNVVSINGTTDTCGTELSFQVHYESVPFLARAAGDYEFGLSSDANFASFYVYRGAFVPEDPTTNCFAADNSVDTGDEKIVDVSFPGPRKLVLVVFDDSFDQHGGAFELRIETPPGVAITNATGHGKRYVRLPASFSCMDGTAKATWTGRADKVRFATFRANRKAVADVIRPRDGEQTKLGGMPARTKKLSARITLKNGNVEKVERTYYAC